MTPYNFIMFFFAAIFVVLQTLIVNFLYKLESIGCQCAMDWRRQYIIFFLILSILYTLFAFFFDPASLPLMQSIMVILGLVNVVVTLQYVYRLKKEKCECSESIYRDVMTFIAIFNAIVYSLLLSVIIFFFYTMASYVKTAKNTVDGAKKSFSIRPLKKITKKITKKIKS